MRVIEFYERRKNDTPVSFPERRLGARRALEGPRSGAERRRLASQVRRYERDAFEIPVRLGIQDRESIGFTRNICVDGLLVVADRPIERGVCLDLQFSFGNKTCYLSLTGQVAFCRSCDSADDLPVWTIGIQFLRVRAFERKVLGAVVREMAQTSHSHEQALLDIEVSVGQFSEGAVELSASGAQRVAEIPTRLRRSSVHRAKIVGWGSYHPEHAISAEYITAHVKSKDHKNVGQVVEALTGIKSRRYDTPDKFPSDLAAEASRVALRDAGMGAIDLDVIIFFGISRDFDEPATANVLQEKIGATRSYVFDIGNACNGFVTAVDLLDSLIASGRCETGLVATGELISPYIDWNPRSREDFKHSIFSYTIGDAGGAAVLSRIDRGEERGIRGRWFLNDGSFWRLAIAGQMPGANPFDKFFKSKGMELELASIQRTPSGVKELLDLLQWGVDDVDLVIPHQIPVSIQQNLYQKALGFPPEKLYWTFPQYGNNATASMPVAVCQAVRDGRLKQGDKVLLLGAAAGYSAGVVALIF